MESTLIIDDNMDASRLMVILLSHCGQEAVAVDSGSKALEYLTHHVPHLILLDVVMPDMNGVQVLKRIRQDHRLASVPVVVFSSASVDPDYVQYMQAQGATEFWVKSDMLFNNLKQLLAPYLPTEQSTENPGYPPRRFSEFTVPSWN